MVSNKKCSPNFSEIWKSFVLDFLILILFWISLQYEKFKSSFHQNHCNGWCGGGVCGSWGNGSHFGSRGTRPARRGKRRAVGIRQWRSIDTAGCLRTQEMGSPQYQATFMHRVSAIVHCTIIATPTTITGIVFYCIICFRKINHLVVKHHLHSSSGVREVVSSTTIASRKTDFQKMRQKSQATVPIIRKFGAMWLII